MSDVPVSDTPVSLTIPVQGTEQKTVRGLVAGALKNDIDPAIEKEHEEIVGDSRTLLEQATENAEVLNLSINEATIVDAANKGAVWIRTRHTESVSSRPVRIRDLRISNEKPAELLLNINSSVLASKPQAISLVREEKNYSIWFKPAGMLCQGTRWGDHCSLARIVECEARRPVHVVHRLDKAASGLILLAHTRPAAKALSTLFAARQVRKIYRATVHGKITLSLPHNIDDAIDGKQAKTIILSGENHETTDTSILLVQIETGRKHQIRQHLSQLGLPIVGDRLFDSEREHSSDLQLTAIELGFSCPFTGNDILVRRD